MMQKRSLTPSITTIRHTIRYAIFLMDRYPVFCGVRGESAEVVCSALRKLKISEKLEGYMVFEQIKGRISIFKMRSDSQTSNVTQPVSANAKSIRVRR